MLKYLTSFFRKLPDQAKRKVKQVRDFASAVSSRLNADWRVASRPIDAELHKGLKQVRAKSRDTVLNNPYGKKFVRTVSNNVIGPKGIQLQSKSGNPELDRKIEKLWKEWGKKKNCSRNKRFSWLDIQRLTSDTVAQDGECLLRFVSDSQNPFGFSLQMVPPEYLDEGYTTTLPNGNRVIMSVELDEWDTPVAYHLTQPPDPLFYRPQEAHRIRVPAEEIIHLYFPSAPDQTRGFPWMASILEYLHMLTGYLEAEVVASRVAASKMGFFKPPTAEEYDGSEDDGDETTTDPELMEECQPGQFGILPKGYEFSSFDPQHPNTAFGEFINTVLRAIASGLNVAHASISSNLSEVNYSSIRAGFLEERDHWRTLQQFWIEHLAQVVFEYWLVQLLLRDLITLDEYQQASDPTWRPRGWHWVDPEKDMQANLLAIQNHLRTRTDVCAEMGEDFEENVATLSKEAQTLKENGFVSTASGMAA